MKTQSAPRGFHPTRLCQRNGFTLLELLVAITIIIIVAALAFAVSGKVRSKAFQANAMSSLRQVAISNVAYATENSGDINTMRWVEDPKEGGPGGWVSNSFWGRMQPYIFADINITNQGQLSAEILRRLNPLFNTPNAKTMIKTVVAGSRVYHDGSGLPVPVSFNSKLNAWNRFVKMSNFEDPARSLYATFGFGFFNVNHGKTYTPRPKGTGQPTTNIYYMDDKSAIMAFLDGHIERVKPPMPARMFDLLQ